MGIPALGLKAALPVITVVADAIPVVALVITWLDVRGRRTGAGRHESGTALYYLGVFALLNVLVTVMNGGAAISAAQYIAAQMRILCLASVLAIRARSPAYSVEHSGARRAFLFDIGVITAVQLAGAAVQLAWPDVGEELIPVTAETQSGVLALAEGHPSGFFPNSIDFAYFALAVYITVSLAAWVRRQKVPGIVFTALIGAFVFSTGSATATGCFALSAAAFYSARWAAGTRGKSAVLLACALSIVAAMTTEYWIRPTREKIENMMLSRLGLILVSVPALISQRPLVLAIGVGSDFRVIEQVIRDLPDVPLIFTYDIASSVINDVYWVGTLLSWGIPFGALYLRSLYKPFRELCSGDRNGVVGKVSVLPAVVTIVVVAGFFNQILLVRSFFSVLLLGVYACRGSLESRGKELAQAVGTERKHPTSPIPGIA